MTSQTSAPSRRSALLWGVGLAIVAGAAAVLFVLPAETGIDLTGFGKSSGLSEMANPQAAETLERGKQHPDAFVAMDAPPQEPGARDHWTYQLAPFEEVELKYVLAKGARIAFTWKADGPLNYDMHAHPDDGGEALTESYAVARGERQGGRYTAAFAGIHGWHWQNRGLTPVTLTLDASGRIDGSRLLGGHGQEDRALTPE